MQICSIEPSNPRLLQPLIKFRSKLTIQHSTLMRLRPTGVAATQRQYEILCAIAYHEYTYHKHVMISILMVQIFRIKGYHLLAWHSCVTNIILIVFLQDRDCNFFQNFEFHHWIYQPGCPALISRLAIYWPRILSACD